MARTERDEAKVVWLLGQITMHLEQLAGELEAEGSVGLSEAGRELRGYGLVLESASSYLEFGDQGALRSAEERMCTELYVPKRKSPEEIKKRIKDLAVEVRRLNRLKRRKAA